MDSEDRWGLAQSATLDELMRYARSLLFNLTYSLWTILAHIVALFPLATGNYRQIVAMIHLWIRGTFFLLRIFCNLTYREKGIENLPHGQAIYAVKHQSAWETLFMVHRFDLPVFVLKKELLSLPLFGRFLRTVGMISIDRAGTAKSVKNMLRQAADRRREGRSIVIFPEGTRVAPGEHRQYRPGIAALYTHLDLPVVPIALNSGLYWGKHAFVKKPGTIIVHYLPAIPPGLNKKEFMAELEQRIETASAALLSQNTL